MSKLIAPSIAALTAVASSLAIVTTASSANERFVGPAEVVVAAGTGDASRASIPPYVLRKTELVCAESSAAPPGCAR